MSAELKSIVEGLINRAKSLERRKIVPVLSDQLETLPPIKVLRGLRGVGKTTVLLQVMAESDQKCFYFSADWAQVRRSTLYDFLLEQLKEGYKLLFIDEIHTYPQWELDVKAIVDQFPEVRLFVSGSAPVVFVGDRRQKLFELEPLDFSEFLFLKYGKTITTDREWRSEEASASLIADHYPDIEGWFKEYFQVGGFPISLHYSFEDTLKAIFTCIRLSIEKDAVSFLKMSSQKLLAMEKLLYFLATSQPGDVNITSLSKHLQISKDSVYEIISAFERMRIIRVMAPYGTGSKLVRGEPKLLFAHPNLRTAVCRQIGLEAKIGSLREELALFGLSIRGYQFFTIKGQKKSPDYVIKKGSETAVVEIGGIGKTRDQLKDFPNPLLLKHPQLITLCLRPPTP